MLSKLKSILKNIGTFSFVKKASFRRRKPKDFIVEAIFGTPKFTESSEHVIKEFSNKTVLITGAAGSIGSEITRQITHFNQSRPKRF